MKNKKLYEMLSKAILKKAEKEGTEPDDMMWDWSLIFESIYSAETEMWVRRDFIDVYVKHKKELKGGV